MNRKDVFYSGSLLNIPMYRSNPDLYHKSITSIHKVGVDSSKEPSPGTYALLRAEIRVRFLVVSDMPVQFLDSVVYNIVFFGH